MPQATPATPRRDRGREGRGGRQNINSYWQNDLHMIDDKTTSAQDFVIATEMSIYLVFILSELVFCNPTSLQRVKIICNTKLCSVSASSN